MAIVPPKLYETLARQAEQEYGVPLIADGKEEHRYDPVSQEDAMAHVAWTGVDDDGAETIRADHRAVSARGDDLHGGAFHPLRGTAPNPAQAKSGEEIRRAGRRLDFAQPYPEVTVTRMDPRLHAALLRQREEQIRNDANPRMYETAGGTVTLAGGIKEYTADCIECGQGFTVRRPASQKRKWPTVCDGCKTERRRRLAAERARRYRRRTSGDEAA
ncbi:hypothetical protein HUT18_03505 [Streptomyces sp. NA04227]|uniref:hypothetical protein n=1 Tax=Streptomyces sp. NA04227 TaxID=2742136 RepID=UPI001590BF0C|nr:hypothetical protein [Streptomyces sp. NA04227]QKW05579.1 hypothetical protein HUT18_03505 [Streptomyces sp. NA04227]